MSRAPAHIPALSTERLTLTGYVLADWPLYRDMLASPRSAFLGGPFGEDEAWGWFTSEIAQWGLFSHGALHGRDTDGRIVCQVNINNPPAWPQEELGFWTYDGHEGRGYASEAARAMRDWYYASHPAPARLASYVHPDNAASRHLLGRLGAKLAPEAPAPHKGWVTYLHPGPEAVQ